MLLPDLKEVSGSPDNVITLRHARRSIYEAGQPEVPLEGSLSLGESRAEYPAGESTRLGAARSPQEQYSASRLNPTFAPIVNSPSGAARQSAHSPSTRAQNSLGRSLQEGRLEDRVDAQRVSQSMMQTAKGKGTTERARSEIGIQYETPEVEREARRVSKRLSQSVLYNTRLNLQEVAEQGSQMTPVVEQVVENHTGRLSMMAKANETGVQVTPGLGEPHLEQTRAEAVGQEDEHEIDGNIAEELDDDEGVAQMEKGIDEALVDEEIATKQVAKRGDVVEHLVEERLDRVDMEEVAEEGDIETADEEDEEEEAEADQGPTSEQGNMEVGSDQDNNEGDYEEEDDFEENGEEVETRDASQAQGTVDISQAELEMPPPGEHRFLPDSSARKAMRHANLERYLGMADVKVDGRGLTNIFTPESSPREAKVVKKVKKAKEPIKTTFPAKKTLQQFNRFSRYKLKKEAEDLVLEASEDFMEIAMARLEQLRVARGDTKIHLCDIRKYMTECGSLLPVEEDFMDIRLFEQIRELHYCDEELQYELIPMRRVMGRVYPPEDIWREPDLGSRKVSKSNKARRSSLTSKKKGLKKADSARRLKVPRNSQSGLAEEDKSGEEEEEAKHGRSKEKKTPKSSANARVKVERSDLQ